jgi:outer membrane receptor protein involved in Fe transport
VPTRRTVETPALDQYGVPATARGGTYRVTSGADARWIEGETRERYFFNHGEFTRDRRAGGRQLFVGVFLEERWQATPSLEFVGGGRLDYWRQYDGHRRERDLLTGSTLQNTALDDQDGVTANGRIGVSAAITRTLRARAASYTGFRAPTLNELYRPFRVGSRLSM